jgi:acetyl esterase/lipase
MPRRPARIALLACLLALPVAGWPGDARPLPDFSVADRLVSADAMPERVIQWSHPGVTMTDMVYSTVPGFRPLHLDLYRPRKGTAALPLIVYLHGGGWANANPRTGAAFEEFPRVLAGLAQRGYAVASIEYRFSGEAPFPAQLDDLHAAIRFLRGNAARFGIDARKLALWGMSAGALLGALGAVNCDEGTCVQGFVGWFGPYDLVSYLRENPQDTSVRPLLDCLAEGCTPKLLNAASPIRYVDRADPPVLLIHGAADSFVLPSQSVRFAEQLRAAGASAEVLLIPDVRHGFIGATPAATKDASRQALMATFEFFDRVLR